MPFRVPAVWASLYLALQSFIDSADAGVSEQISSVAKADADKSVADADMRETPKMRGRMPHDEPRLLGRVRLSRDHPNVEVTMYPSSNTCNRPCPRAQAAPDALSASQKAARRAAERRRDRGRDKEHDRDR